MPDSFSSRPACLRHKGGYSLYLPAGTHYAPGVSKETAGATSLWLGIVTLKAGHHAQAHVHEHHETAFFMMSGKEVEKYGPALSSIAAISSIREIISHSGKPASCGRQSQRRAGGIHRLAQRAHRSGEPGHVSEMDGKVA